MKIIRDSLHPLCPGRQRFFSFSQKTLGPVLEASVCRGLERGSNVASNVLRNKVVVHGYWMRYVPKYRLDIEIFATGDEELHLLDTRIGGQISQDFEKVLSRLALVDCIYEEIDSLEIVQAGF